MIIAISYLWINIKLMEYSMESKGFIEFDTPQHPI